MATLVIGIGGTGYEAINRMKARLPESTNSLRYYFLDSAQKEAESLPPGSSRFIGGFDVGTVVKKQARAVAPWWFPRNYAPEYMATLGTGKNRLIGRVGYFMNGGTIEQDLRTIFGDFVGSTVTIYIVCSAGGGQGSSICVDIAMLCQKILTGGTVQFDIIAVLLDPTVVYNTIDYDDNSFLAGLATLTEIEYYNTLASRKSLKKYSFAVLGQSPFVSATPPFKLVFLIQHKNENEELLDAKEDYYEMLASGIASLIAVSDHSAQILNFPGKKVGGTGIENFFLSWISKGVKGDFSTKWGSYGTVELVIPIEEVSEYCIRRSGHEVISQFLIPLSPDEKTTVTSFLDTLFSGKSLWESNQRERLQERIVAALCKDQKAKDIFGDRAGLIKKLSLAMHAAKMNFEATLANRTRELKDYLADYLSKAKDISKHPDFVGLKQSVIDSLKSQKDVLLGEGRVSQAETLLEDFRARLAVEIQDLQENEKAWQEKLDENRLMAVINSQITEIKSKKRRLFEKEAKYLERVKPRKEQLAKYWIENFHRYIFLKAFLDSILAFYEELSAEADKLLGDIIQFREQMKSLRSAYEYAGLLLNSIDIVERKTGNPDFVLRVCSAETVVSRMVFPKIDLKEIRSRLLMGGIRGISDEQLRGIIEDRVKLDVLDQLDLESGLRHEAEYIFDELRANFEKLPLHQIRGLKLEFSKFISAESFDCVWELYQEQKSGTRVKRDAYIGEIMNGRVVPLIKKFAAPYWSVNKAALRESVSEDKRSLVSMSSRLTALQQIVNSCLPNCPFYNNNDRFHMTLFIAEGGMPIYTLSQLTALAGSERKRRAMFFKDGKPLPADTDGIFSCFYNDRIFIEDEERSRFSIILEDGDEDVYRYFALGEMFGIVKPAGKERANFKLAVGLDAKFPAGFVLGKGLKQALNTITNSSDLMSLIKSNTDAKLAQEKVRDLAGLTGQLKALNRSYGTMMRVAGPELREIYESLRLAIKELGLTDGVDAS